MARYLFIVSMQETALHDELLQRFSDDPNAEVILDRRRAERRQAEIPGEIPGLLERRQADRRRRPGVNEELRRSVAIVEIS
jgi:hypothetical protein